MRAYRRATGTVPYYPAAPRRAGFRGRGGRGPLRDNAGGIGDTAVHAAACRLTCTTLFDRFPLHPETGLQAGHEVLTVQWQDGARRVVWPPRRVERPLRHPRPAG